VPCKMPGSLVDIQKEYDSVPFGCQEERGEAKTDQGAAL
jgi:hypothetical protein